MKFVLTNLALAFLVTLTEGHSHVRSGEKDARHHHKNAPRTHPHKDPRSKHYKDPRTKSHHKDPRIMGGSPVAEGEFPFFVGIQDDCGGALIGPKVVLTAAHCTNQEWIGKTLIVGGTGVCGDVKGGGVEVEMESYVNFPGYCPTCDPMKPHENTPGQGDGSWHYDIALVYLKEEVRMDTSITFSLGQDLPSVGTWMTVVGQGILWDEGPDPKEVGKVNLQMVSEEECNNDDNYEDSVLYPKAFCAGREEGKAHCSGDSGGPLMVVNGNHHTQYGVVSGSSGCGKHPGIYSSTASVYGWIQENTCGKGLDAVVCGGSSGTGGGGNGGGTGGGTGGTGSSPDDDDDDDDDDDA